MQWAVEQEEAGGEVNFKEGLAFYSSIGILQVRKSRVESFIPRVHALPRCTGQLACLGRTHAPNMDVLSLTIDGKRGTSCKPWSQALSRRGWLCR